MTDAAPTSSAVTTPGTQATPGVLSEVADSTFASAEVMESAFTRLKQTIPEIPSAYNASWKTTVSAILVMVACTIPIGLILLAITGGLSLAYDYAWSLISSDQNSVQRLFGLLAFLVDGVILIAMGWLPVVFFKRLSIISKNRNALLASLLAGVISCAVSAVLFLPIFDGQTLAPTDLEFIVIPVQWVLIPLGLLLAPLISVAMVYDAVGNLKFCEEARVFLKPTRNITMCFDAAGGVLPLLRNGNLAAACAMSPEPAKHGARLEVLGHPKTALQYVEMFLVFDGKAGDKTKSETWRVFSEKTSPAATGVTA